MKTLTIGLLVLLGWIAASTYIYVCKIKGFCNEREAVMINNVSVADLSVVDSMPNNLVSKQVTKPESIVIHFEFDKSDFNTDEKTNKWVNEYYTYLEHNPETSLIITGHTDATGTEDYNKALGNRRAESVLLYFKGTGSTTKKIMIESHGEKEPIDDNGTAEGRANNRRTEIRIK